MQVSKSIVLVLIVLPTSLFLVLNPCFLVKDAGTHIAYFWQKWQTRINSAGLYSCFFFQWSILCMFLSQ